MNRIQKITRLTEIGFNPIELSRHSGALLDATYEAALPLMAVREEEMRKVVAREQLNAVRKHGRIVRKERETVRSNRDIELEQKWIKNWKPLPPICTVRVEIDGVIDNIRTYEAEYALARSEFRKTGHRRFADAANKARRCVDHCKGQLVHLGKVEGHS